MNKKNYFFKTNNLLFAICYLLICLSTNAFAFVDKQNAVVRVMDKAAGKTQTITMPVGASTKVAKLTVVPRACKQTDPLTPENMFMFVEISKDGALIFSNWMSKNDPGDNPLQDADYDLWLVRCE